MSVQEAELNSAIIRQECVKLLDQSQYVKGIISTVNRDPDPGTITAICTVCHTLMAHNKLLVHKARYKELNYVSERFLLKALCVKQSVSRRRCVPPFYLAHVCE